jgi:hypothetical protein
MAIGRWEGQASRGTGRGTPQALRPQVGGQYESVCHTAVVFVSLLGGMFVLGFVSGSVSQRPAQAQVPGVGGALGSVKELGASIVEMQQHVDGLQKNLATLKKVEAALGGGK